MRMEKGIALGQGMIVLGEPLYHIQLVLGSGEALVPRKGGRLNVQVGSLKMEGCFFAFRDIIFDSKQQHWLYRPVHVLGWVGHELVSARVPKERHLTK